VFKIIIYQYIGALVDNIIKMTKPSAVKLKIVQLDKM